MVKHIINKLTPGVCEKFSELLQKDRNDHKRKNKNYLSSHKPVSFSKSLRNVKMPANRAVEKPRPLFIVSTKRFNRGIHANDVNP